MANFKNKLLDTRKRKVRRVENAQLQEIDERVKRFEYRDLFFSILFVIFVVFLLTAIIYAGTLLVRGYIL